MEKLPTVKQVESLEPKDKAYHDKSPLEGHCLRVAPSGRKTFLLC
jgi:hypothetical protein